MPGPSAVGLNLSATFSKSDPLTMALEDWDIPYFPFFKPWAYLSSKGFVNGRICRGLIHGISDVEKKFSEKKPPKNRK